MDHFQRLQDETGIHPEEIGTPTDDRWLVLYLLLYVRDGDFRIGELAERLGGMGFDGVTPGRLHKTVQQLKEKGLLKEGPSVSDGDVSGSGVVKQRYGLTPAGDYYLRIWGDSLKQYGRELVHEDDLPLLWFLVSLVMEEPGASESVEVRFRNAWGDWVLMDVCVLNVLEAPTSSDTGLLVVNVRQRKERASWRTEMPNGN